VGRCSCSGNSTCACVVEGGDGILVTGAGTVRNPYSIVSTAAVERYFQTLDTPSLDLTLEGGGTPSNPFKLSGEATLALVDLSDVGEGQAPASGDVPVWVVDHWEFQPPPGGVAPDGTTVTVTTGAGLLGTGTGATPLKAAVSGTWGSGSMTGFPVDRTLGVPIYTDNAGQLRARPEPVVRFIVNPLGSYAAGWAAWDSTVLWYRKGQEVYFRAAVTRTGASISATSGNLGNIANTQIGTLASALPTPLLGEWPCLVTSSGAMLNLYVDGNRNLIVSAMSSGAKITTGDNFSIVGRYWATDGVVL
jgi:hypothetical protein